MIFIVVFPDETFDKPVLSVYDLFVDKDPFKDSTWPTDLEPEVFFMAAGRMIEQLLEDKANSEMTVRDAYKIGTLDIEVEHSLMGCCLSRKRQITRR